MSRPETSRRCTHATLQYEASSEAEETGYEQPSPHQRMAATTASGETPMTAFRAPNRPDAANLPSTFPAPLVLPGDEISWSPDYEPQSLKSWLDNSHRNEVTQARRTIYLVPPPEADESVGFVKDWAEPSTEAGNPTIPLTKPRPEDIKDYLEAFYHPWTVKVLPSALLKWAPFPPTKGTGLKGAKYIGLKTSTTLYGIRYRPSKDGLFAAQLDLTHLLDVAISILPKDAYALLMMTNHDLYEGKDDDFCCGRAYGGSRVAVVSSSRYSPLLDDVQKVEREHAWPASHCREYGDACCRNAGTKPSKKPPMKFTGDYRLHGFPAAVAAYSASSDPHFTTARSLESLWLSRVLKTASHELGHCFCLDHCVYYACVMQATTGLTEDARQPPYLCPVDLVKVLHATGGTAEARYGKLIEFCEKHSSSTEHNSGTLNAFAAWLRVRLAQVNGRRTID